MDRGLLWLAQGLGSGRLPWVPGTWGSLMGLVWLVVLLLPGPRWFFWAGALGGAAAAVGICHRAERLLGRPDPPAVVLDEIIAVPLCFVSWILLVMPPQGMPAPAYFFTANRLWVSAALFAAFRLLDIAKPWPVRQSQRLPGGWGIVIDDVLASFYVNISFLVAWGCGLPV